MTEVEALILIADNIESLRGAIITLGVIAALAYLLS